MSPPPGRLLVVTDRPRVHPPALASQRLLDALEGVLRGGARWIWFRERDLPEEARRALAGAVARRVRAYGGTLGIGADPVLARDLGAKGVHLQGGTTEADIARARDLLPAACLGVSAHAPADIAAAARAGADYVTLSPIFPTASKPGYGPALGPEALGLGAAFGIPVIALGGVTRDRIAACRAAGAAGIAVMGGLMRSPDPEAEARAYRAVLDDTFTDR